MKQEDKLFELPEEIDEPETVERSFETYPDKLRNLAIQRYEFLNAVRQRLVGGWTAKNLEPLIINGYGPTENTVFSLAYEIPATINSAQRNIPIGTPIKGVNFRIDNHADEEFGELLLTGQGLAAGYLNDDALNQTQFVTIQDDKKTALYYRTGDLVAVRNGLVYFQGRVDNQTKINGYRVDLGELEMVACQCDDIEDAVAVVVADEWKFIALVVRGTGSHELSILKAFLAQRLPFYMLPKLCHRFFAG